MTRKIWILLVVVVCATACTDPGSFDDSDAGIIVDSGDRTDADRTDATSCDDCRGATPVCNPATGECVECLEDDDCPTTAGLSCDESTNACVACAPDQRTDWYPDEDGDGFGDTNAEPTKACQQPSSMVANAEDCNDDEAMVHPSADEICNGRDDNCNGISDADESQVEPVPCSQQAGVCGGATVATCNASGDGYASCGPQQFGDDYVDAPDEDWRCDGKDNNCDGAADKVCCGADETPSPAQVGSDSTDQISPVIVPAAEGAPDGATYLAAWAEGDTILVQHLDEIGGELGTSGSATVNSATGLAAVRVDAGYAVAVSAEGNAATVNIVEFDASLTSKTTETFDPNTSGQIENVSVAVDGQTLWTTYSYQTGDSEHVIRAATVNLQNGMVGYEPFQVSPSGKTLPQPGAPEIAMVDGTPTVVWWDAPSEKIRGAALGSGIVDSRFNFSVVAVNSVKAKSIELFGHNGKRRILYPQYDQSGTSALGYAAINADKTGTVGSGQEITGRNADHRQPTAMPVDDEHMLVSWAREKNGDFAIVAGRAPFAVPSDLSGRILGGNGSEPVHPVVSSSDYKAGTIWLNTVNGNSRDVKFAPLSTDGTPICK